MNFRVLDDLSAVGVVAGFAMLVTSFFAEDLRPLLAAPGLLVLVPSLIYGMR